MASTLLQVESSSWSTADPSSHWTPQLFTRMPTASCAASTSPQKERMSSAEAASQRRKRKDPPSELSSSSSLAPASVSTSAHHTCAPARTKARQMPAPIPLAPPVTTTTWSSKPGGGGAGGARGGGGAAARFLALLRSSRTPMPMPRPRSVAAVLAVIWLPPNIETTAVVLAWRSELTRTRRDDPSLGLEEECRSKEQGTGAFEFWW
mmetsp:Transcript_27819/g.55718  ORF Transcript_27819/g.55718 Transcript_27819/m.55718 type:complete len:207 (-) Transcript_27819:13-633(-)